LLGEQIVVRSPLPLEQVHDRLAAEVDVERDPFVVFLDTGTDRDSDFVGRIRATSFSIRRRRRLMGPHRGANPRAQGALARLPDGGTVITASFPRDVWQRILLIPVVVLAVPYIVNERDAVFRIVELVLLAAIVVFGVAPGGLGKRQIRELLEEVATPRDAWRPYAGRADAEPR
jgi:hypothetical protein